MQPVTELYEKLKPFILRDINVVMGGKSLIGSRLPEGGEQFLKSDGSRSLTGHLSVESGITIDNVQISTHASNVNAHHNRDHAIVSNVHTATGLNAGQVIRATGPSTFEWDELQHGDLAGISANQHHNQEHALAGSDHTASGLTTGHTLRATGATTFAWAQLQHSDLGGVTADQHHAGFVALTDDDSTVVSPDANDRIKIAGGSGLTSTAGTNVVTLAVGAGDGITVNANDVALTTPGTLTAQTVSSSSDNHVHTVSAYDNPGANERLLKSTSSGGLTLESFVSNGEITAGESLYAGSNGFRVIAHSSPYDHVHVVINPGGSWTTVSVAHR